MPIHRRRDKRRHGADANNNFAPPGGRFDVSTDAGATWTAGGPVSYSTRLGISPDGRVVIAIIRSAPEEAVDGVPIQARPVSR